MNGDIDLTCSLNRKYIPPTTEQKLFLKIEIAPTETTSKSFPLTVCLLIDKSGSMAGKKLRNAKEGAIKLVNQLDSNDYCGVVAFEKEVDVVVPGKYVEDTSFFETKIQKIKWGGLTELYRGLETAFEVLRGQLQQDDTERETVKRIILLSDGYPTDNKTESEYRSLARFMREIGISITALGIGKDYNENLLSAIAEESGGMWYHITAPGRIPDVFSSELSNMRTVVFSRPELVLQLSQGVELVDICKSRPDVHRITNVTVEGTTYRVPLMDMRAGERQTIVARIAVPPRPEGEWRIAQVGVASGGITRREDVTVQYTPNESLWKETDPYSRTLFAVTETQIRVREGLSGDVTALRQAKTQLKTLLKDPEATRINDIADRTLMLEKVLDRTAKVMSEEERKKVKSDLTRVRR